MLFTFRQICAAFLLVSALAPGLCGAQPAPPAEIEALAMAPRDVRIYWKPAAGAAKHVILRDDRPLAEVPGTASEFQDRTAEPGVTYRYNVAAHFGPDTEHPEPLVLAGREYVERAFADLPEVTHCDLLVVGANSAGWSAAVTAARYGVKTVMIEETRRIGGMAANGLGASDIRRIDHSSGMFEEFRREVQSLYGEGNGLRYEPRVAQQAIKKIVWGEPELVVHRLVRPVQVRRKGRLVTEVIAEHVPSGRRVRFVPRFVVDATECGDVAAWAGAKFRVGREPRSAREPHAGHIFYDRASDSRMPGSTGRGDRRIQAYSYLMTVKDHGPGADRTIPEPPGYDAAKYRGAPRWPHSWNATSGKLPNNKYEINQHPHGSDLQGTNYTYPTATYAERRRMEQEFKNHALGYLYFMQTEQGMKQLGLSEEDYRDSDGWPALLYIREARRFESERVIDETDIMEARKIARPDSIGIGDYAMDSHATQPAPEFNHYAPNPKHMGEGEFYLPQYTPWHQVPFGIMIPKGFDNLFTPTAVSATHVAYGTYRMEPVRMHFGAAAGAAVYLCMKHGLAPAAVPVRQIQLELTKALSSGPGRPARDGFGAPGPLGTPVYLYMFSDVTFQTRKYRAIQWLAARGFWPCPEPQPRNARTVLDAAPFRPDDPVTAAEANDALRRLAARAGRPYPRAEGSAAPLTRAEAARLVADFMGWKPEPGAHHYADVPPGHPAYAAAEALMWTSIDSRLWDDGKALAPDGKLYFRPDETLTRAQLAEILYLAHMHFGPLWYDHAVDAGVIRVQ